MVGDCQWGDIDSEEGIAVTEAVADGLLVLQLILVGIFAELIDIFSASLGCHFKEEVVGEDVGSAQPFMLLELQLYHCKEVVDRHSCYLVRCLTFDDFTGW